MVIHLSFSIYYELQFLITVFFDYYDIHFLVQRSFMSMLLPYVILHVSIKIKKVLFESVGYYRTKVLVEIREQ